MEVEKRFDRLEVKIDKLTDVVADLARMEERLVSQSERMTRIESRVDTVENGLLELADAVRANTSAVNFANKLFWTVIAAVISLAVYSVK